jgi:high-affinity nickel-transport protein
MYPIGFLFGLGFDTATEVALLVLAGTAVVGGLPFYTVLSYRCRSCSRLG